MRQWRFIFELELMRTKIFPMVLGGLTSFHARAMSVDFWYRLAPRSLPTSETFLPLGDDPGRFQADDQQSRSLIPVNGLFKSRKYTEHCFQTNELSFRSRTSCYCPEYPAGTAWLQIIFVNNFLPNPWDEIQFFNERFTSWMCPIWNHLFSMLIRYE